MVQIKIENRHDNEGALNIIDTKITNIKEKVQCLQQYVPKLLKDRHVDTTKKLDSALNNARIADRQKQEKRILEIVKEIAKALVDYTKHNKRFEVFKDKGFELKSHQKVRIEDLL